LTLFLWQFGGIVTGLASGWLKFRELLGYFGPILKPLKGVVFSKQIPTIANPVLNDSLDEEQLHALSKEE